MFLIIGPIFLHVLTMSNRCVSFALMAASLPPMIILVNRTPDQIPADVIAAEKEKGIDSASLNEPAPTTIPLDQKV
jgi:hypothetical protein